MAVTPYSAAYGGAATGFINTVTKSGAEVLHGGAFYYLRHSATGANDVVDKANGIAKPLNVLEQFGADLGGRLIRRKLWFYVGYEQQKRKEPISIVDPDVDESILSQTCLPGTLLPAPNAHISRCPAHSAELRRPDDVRLSCISPASVECAQRDRIERSAKRERRRDDLRPTFPS